MTTSYEEQIAADKKAEKMERILNHSYPGEGYINGPPIVWKKLVLYHFNKVKRDEITLSELLQKLQQSGVTFNQSDSLVKYPVIKCLEYIAKTSKVESDIKE